MKNAGSYREILKQEFTSRKNLNPHYSQAAFARDLGIQPPKLSQIFSGDCGLSSEKARKVAIKLGLSEVEVEHFSMLVASQHARKRADRVEATKILDHGKASDTIHLRAKQFDLIKDWHHFAVMNLMNSATANRDPKIIARRLEIPVKKVRQSVDLLHALELIDQAPEQLQARLVKTTEDVPSRANRHFQTQILAKAATSLAKDPVESREFHTLVFLADKKQITKMKSDLRMQSLHFLNNFEDLQSADLYSLSVQLMPLTKKDDRTISSGNIPEGQKDAKAKTRT